MSKRSLSTEGNYLLIKTDHAVFGLPTPFEVKSY